MIRPPKIPPRIAAGLMTGIVAASLTIALPFVQTNEGRHLTAYQDPGGRWTICDGNAINIQRGDKATTAECDAETQTRVAMTAKAVQKMVAMPIPAPVLAAFTDFAYNVGLGSFARSTALKRLKKGNLQGACDELTRWHFLDGKDCQIKSNNCYGIVTRRDREKVLCEKGLGKAI